MSEITIYSDFGAQENKVSHSFPTRRSSDLDGETMKTVTDFIFLGSKITIDGDYSHEIKT